ncbi:MAG TPA: FRG domain-containing protein [Gemmatimonadaceae bacterium]|nr:FRG domain-containing protein [Gemmatimonadaceae bacterium]
MTVRQVVVHSLGEFVDVVTPREPDQQTGRRRDTGVYRGASNAMQPLLTSLDRLGGTRPPHTKADLEEHILRNFIRYSRPHLDEARPHDDWELLIAAQHHGVPTRLLDWTYSPLVAAFFATRPADGDECDRAVWRLDWQAVHRKFKLPSLALLTQDLDSTLGGNGKMTPWRLFADKDAKAFACMIEPPSLDSRIVAQAATFTLCSCTKTSFDAFLEDEGLRDALTKFLIPRDAVPRVRDQLDLVGIDERRLFPDLDGVASTIQRYYA